jgi:outer membrane protein OmpA-like peptidoglycan-associated protein
MPRGEYTWRGPEPQPDLATAPKVSMDRYEATLELYEAQNALGIARSANAEKYAAQTLSRAQQLYDAAYSMNARKGESKTVVQDAREAVQTAEDARMIAQRKQEEEAIASARIAADTADQARVRAESDAARARAEAEDARAQADADRAAREQAEAAAADARRRADQIETARNIAPAAAPPITTAPARIASAPADTKKTDLRMSLLENMNGVLPSRDTGRGLVATVADSDFSGSELHPGVSSRIGRIAAIVIAHPGLRVDVEGNSDSDATAPVASERAEAVRSALIAQGAPSSAIAARGLGSSRLIGPNSSPTGHEANRRVEIVISGAPIGDMAFWDKPYSVTPQR